MNRFYILLFTLFLSTVFAFAQTQVKGTILDENGEGAIGVNIVAEGTTVGTVTDFDGNFEINVPAGVKNIVISYIGYKTQKLPVKPFIKATLESDAKQLDEVVVTTGMVVYDKRTFTGATKQLDAESTALSGMADISRSLDGRAAGVSVQTVSGTFGAAPKIRVRGATSLYGSSKPLWVVDGVILEDAVEISADNLGSGNAETLISNAIAGLNADDIESIQILKDGSATSIYGARAMAGVIVVTTKKGIAGQTKLNYTGELTYRMKPSYRDYNIMNSQEQMSIYKELREKGWLEASTLNTAKQSGIYGTMFRLIDTYDATSGQFGLANTPEAMNNYLREAEYRNTDWFDLLFNDNVMMNHSLSFSTGTDRARLYTSLSAMYDPGWYKQSSVQRYTGNAKANFDLLPSKYKQKLTLSVNTNGSYIKQNAPGTVSASADPVSGRIDRDFDINPFSYALNSSRALDPTAQYRRSYCNFNIFDELDQNYMDITRTDVKFQAELNYKPIKGLEIAGLAAIRYNSNKRETYVMDNSNQARAYRAGLGIDDGDVENDLIRDKNEYLYTDPDDVNAQPQSVLPVGGIYTVYLNDILSVDFRGTIRYNHGFANDGTEGEDHLINIFAGVESNSTNRTAVTFEGWGYQFDNGGIPAFDYTLFKQYQEENSMYYAKDDSYYRNLSFFGTATYSYKSRYTINGTVRYEGSNQLGRSRKARWMPTWNVSGMWNADAENFWHPTFDRWWTEASLKASYSLTANRGPVSNSLAVLRAYNPWRPHSSVTETTIQLQDIENSELTYEKKYEFNVGTHLAFIDSRIALDVDYFYRDNYDLIGIVQTQGVGGTTLKYANDASMKSSGVEVSISTVNLNYKNFRWTSDLVFSHITNEITKLDTRDRVYEFLDGSGRKVGYPVNAVFSIPFAGLTDEGLPTFFSNAQRTETYNPSNYSDINFQGYDIDYLKYEGTLDPKIDGSFNNEFTIFQNLKIGIYLTYRFGNVVRLDDLCYVYNFNYNDLSASLREMRNRWVVAGDENTTNIPVIASKRQYATIADLSYAYSAYNKSDLRIAKGDFIRLKEVSIEYTFPKKWFANQTAVSSFSAKLSGTNLALLYADKKLNGQDPEFFNTGGVASPAPRQFTLTLRLGF